MEILKKLGLDPAGSLRPPPLSGWTYVASEFQVECFPTLEAGHGRPSGRDMVSDLHSSRCTTWRRRCRRYARARTSSSENLLSIDRLDGVEELGAEAAKRGA